ncbi:hypothetical protein Za10_1473 [Zymomonas mobilis subsp. mobilis NCIMB 11163]|nr:hypothetical protein Za10_1473 [Zymomonas mobilis subsp. mobilis NCIMB 11163]
MFYELPRYRNKKAVNRKGFGDFLPKFTKKRPFFKKTAFFKNSCGKNRAITKNYFSVLVVFVVVT